MLDLYYRMESKELVGNLYFVNRESPKHTCNDEKLGPFFGPCMSDGKPQGDSFKISGGELGVPSLRELYYFYHFVALLAKKSISS